MIKFLLGSKAVWTFLITAIKSIWGIFYLIFLLLLGWLWNKKWGFLLLSGVLLIGIFLMGIQYPYVLDVINSIFSSSPVNIIQAMLIFSAAKFGSIGWGILLSSLLMIVSLYPAYYVTYWANRLMRDVPLIRRLLGTRSTQEYLATKGFNTIQLSISSIFTSVIGLVFPISLWIALRRLAGMSLKIPLSFLIIPNLTIPSFKPVFQISYFLLPLMLGGVNIMLLSNQKKYYITALTTKYQNPYSSIIGSLILALFIPAGVMLYLIGQSIGQILIIPRIFLEKGKVEKLKPSPKPKPKIKLYPKPKPGIEPYPKLKPKIKPYYKPLTPEPKLKPFLAGTLLYKSVNPVTDIIFNNIDDYYVLDERGNIFYMKNRREVNKLKLNLSNPIGLENLSDGKIIAIGKEGKLLVLKVSEKDFTIDDDFNTNISIDYFSLNPFKTMLAYTSSLEGTVYGMFISSHNEQIFATNLENLNKIAFSNDGRYLAIGYQSGKIDVLDVASHEIVKSLVSNIFGVSPIEHISAGYEDSWLVVYKNKYLASWKINGQLSSNKKLSSLPASMAVDTQTGIIALGSRKGYIRILSSDFKNTLFSKKVHKSKINKILVLNNAKTIVSVGNDGSIRMIRR